MEINTIKVMNEGHVLCKSSFYTARSVLRQDERFVFSTGINKIVGEIDSGTWAVSYLLSMPHKIDSHTMLYPMNVMVDDVEFALKDFKQYVCYMDRSHPLFTSVRTIRALVESGCKKYGGTLSADEIRELFKIDPDRFDRRLSYTGNERFNAMAAIAFSHKKEVYCFPWLSRMRAEAFRCHLTDVLSVLESLGKVVIVPVGKD